MPTRPARRAVGTARRRLAALAAALLAAAGVATTAATPSQAGPAIGGTAPVATATSAQLPLGHAGRWITDAAGRVVVVHGVNQVYKTAPYEPGGGGFGADDAAFLAANGFDAVRVGVIWAAVEPRPGVYDDAYLASVADTVNTLAAHGIVSLLDFHQDLFNEQFGGEGAPAWAVQDGGRPNPSFGFPGNYFGNLAEDHAWDAFWADAPAPDGVGLQEHFAAAWQHVAAYFAASPSVLGYELINEPWPGTGWEPCAVPVLGCPRFDATLTRFYQKVTDAIRAADPTRTVWIEPTLLFATVDTTHLGTVRDPNVGFAFHDYCATEAELQTNLLCTQLDALSLSAARRYSTQHDVPWLMTEWGATNDLANLGGLAAQADRYRLGWLEWAYTGNDKTSTSPTGQALVYDPAQPPGGANVNQAKLAVLAEPYPQVIAGTPSAWSYRGGVFRLRYTPARPGGGTFAAGSVTVVATPAVAFPDGYAAQVSGGHVVSAPGAATLLIASDPGATSITVTVTAP